MGASGLIMAILGGALLTPLQAVVSDAFGIYTAYLVPLACFAVVLSFALYAVRKDGRFGERICHSERSEESMKRYCQSLTLVDDEEMIARYVDAHAHVWPEVIAGQRKVGILSMEIWRRGRSLFMIMDTVDGFDFARDMARLATLPRQAEWEAYVARFQGCEASASSAEKWHLMEKIFDSKI